MKILVYSIIIFLILIVPNIKKIKKNELLIVASFNGFRLISNEITYVIPLLERSYLISLKPFIIKETYENSSITFDIIIDFKHECFKNFIKEFLDNEIMEFYTRDAQKEKITSVIENYIKEKDSSISLSSDEFKNLIKIKLNEIGLIANKIKI